MELTYFFTTSTFYWSKGSSFKEAFDNLKRFTAKPCECSVFITEDSKAYIHEVSGALCHKKGAFAKNIGKFKLSQSRLSPIS